MPEFFCIGMGCSVCLMAGQYDSRSLHFYQAVTHVGNGCNRVGHLPPPSLLRCLSVMCKCVRPGDWGVRVYFVLVPAPAPNVSRGGWVCRAEVYQARVYHFQSVFCFPAESSREEV